MERPPAAPPSRSILRALERLRPWTLIVSVAWLAGYGVQGLALLYVIATMQTQSHPAARVVTILSGFFLLFVCGALLAAALLLNSALALGRLGPHPTHGAVEAALQRLSAFWTTNGILWIVSVVGSVVAFAAALMGALIPT